MTRRVVVTGLGLVTPVGNTLEESWSAIKAGKTGGAPITSFDTSNYLVKIAAEVKGFVPEDRIPRKLIRRTDPYQQFILAAAQEAAEGTDFEVKDGERSRTSILIGSAVGGIHTYEKYAKIVWNTGDPRKMTPFGIPMLMANGGSALVAIELGANGPSATLVSACATGADCIGYTFDLIRAGRIDRALTGAGEAPILNLGIAAFDRIQACSRDNDTPERAVRPFSRNRTGMMFGEGCGVLVLEELEYARARGANILAELVGFGSTSDAFHITAPDPEATGASEAIKRAMADAGVNADEIDYINAHGTGTPLNDSMETNAVKIALGEHAYTTPMSSTKSMTGHAMGATAAMEAAFAVLAIRDQVAPPTMNYEEVDPECDLDYVPNEARSMDISCVMSNSFGFGGHNASLIFKAIKD